MDWMEGKIKLGMLAVSALNVRNKMGIVKTMRLRQKIKMVERVILKLKKRLVISHRTLNSIDIIHDTFSDVY
jgi:hypothetical protein